MNNAVKLSKESTVHDYRVMQASTTETRTFNGVDHSDRELLASHLTKVLANTYVLNLKTQNLHWNVVGPLFYSIHKLTEEQYTQLSGAIDAIAERIRMIGFPAPASIKHYAELSDILEDDLTNVSVEEFVNSLVVDHDLIAQSLRDAVEEAEKRNDVRTADLLTEQIGFHEESAWMLRALITK